MCFVFLDVAHKPLLHLLSSAMLGLSAERSLAAAPRISFTAVRGEKKTIHLLVATLHFFLYYHQSCVVCCCMVTKKVWGGGDNTVLRGLEVNALPSTGNRGAGPDDLCTGRLTEEVSK